MSGVTGATPISDLEETERDFARTNYPYWKFDSDDREYYAFCRDGAERLDRRQISYSQFDSARIQKYNQIRARREQINQMQQQTETMKQNQELIRKQQRQLEDQNISRPTNCTSSVIGNNIYTNCY